MNNLAPKWRLIVTSPLSALENMAIDEALFSTFDPRSSLPVLRLYGWNPPAISLGRFQKTDEVLNIFRCRKDYLTIVRRITGGGAIYHADELTYSLVCSPQQIPKTLSIKDSFRVLTGFLLLFYQMLGIDARYAVDVLPKGTKLGERTDFCFAGIESFDIIANGLKIGGNAQRRTKDVIFQHGSIPLINHTNTGLSYMKVQNPECAQKSASLYDFNLTINIESLQEVVELAFKKHFAVTLQNDLLSKIEIGTKERLLLEKYNSNLSTLNQGVKQPHG